jgi:hypothetical protein
MMHVEMLGYVPVVRSHPLVRNQLLVLPDSPHEVVPAVLGASSPIRYRTLVVMNCRLILILEGELEATPSILGTRFRVSVNVLLSHDIVVPASTISFGTVVVGIG